MSADIIIYTKDDCLSCSAAITLLNDRELAFDEINISKNREAIDEMISKGGNENQLPQIFIDQKLLGSHTELLLYFDSENLSRDLKACSHNLQN